MEPLGNLKGLGFGDYIGLKVWGVYGSGLGTISSSVGKRALKPFITIVYTLKARGREPRDSNTEVRAISILLPLCSCHTLVDSSY